MRKGLILLVILFLLVAVAGTVGAQNKRSFFKDNFFQKEVIIRIILEHIPCFNEDSFHFRKDEPDSGMVTIMSPLEVFAD